MNPLGTIENTDRQVRIQLCSKDAALQLPTDIGSILVPASLRSENLSDLVNDLLSTAARVPLDFLVNGFPLSSSLATWLTANGASTETTLLVEYSRALLPPEHQSSFPHDACVGAVDILSASSPASQDHGFSTGQERILSASFDGCVRVWSASGTTLAMSEGAMAPDEVGNRTLADGRLPFLQATRFVSPALIVASGWCNYLQLWTYKETTDGPASLQTSSASLETAMYLHGHTMAVNSIDVHSASGRIVSASDDGTALLWTSDESVAPRADSKFLHSSGAAVKRRKLSSSTASHLPEYGRGPLAQLASHKGPVQSAVFHPRDPTVAYTASADSSILTWDLETSRSVSSRAPGGPHTPLRSLCALPDLGLLAAATGDRRILLVDPRESAERSNNGSLRGHKNIVTSMDKEPGNPYGIASGSFDGCVRIWDTRRASKPVSLVQSKEAGRSSYKIPRRAAGERCERIEGGHGVKVYGLRWDRDVGLVSAGEDQQVQIDRVQRSQ